MLNNNSNNAHLHTHINPSRSSFIENLLWFLWVSTAIMHRERREAFSDNVDLCLDEWIQFSIELPVMMHSHSEREDFMVDNGN